MNHAQGDLQDIKRAYNKSLHEKKIEAALLIQVKNLMENLRSVLDFGAHGIYEKYCSGKKAHSKVCFPYATLSDNEFQFQKRVEKCIPGISMARPEAIIELKSFQHFSHPDNRWLPIFMELNNENKHQRLTPQVRKENKELKLTSGGASLSMLGGGSLVVGNNSEFLFGGTVIPGGIYNVDNPPAMHGPGKVEIITWVSFNFSSNNQPVLPFLEQSLGGVRKILTSLVVV